MKNDIFEIVNNQLKVKNTDEIIPDEEPVFILRACDKQSLSVVRVYQSTLRPTSEAWKQLQDVIDDFTSFQNLNRLQIRDPSEMY